MGECNNCGACCQFVLLVVSPSYLEADRRQWLALHGITLAERDGMVFATVPSRCTALTEDNKCGIYGKPERPEVCAEFPFVQSDIDIVNDFVGVQACSYSFAEGHVATAQ